VGDSPTDQVQEDMDSEVYPSEDGNTIFFKIFGTVELENIFYESLTYLFFIHRIGESRSYGAV